MFRKNYINIGKFYNKNNFLTLLRTGDTGIIAKYVNMNKDKKNNLNSLQVFCVEGLDYTIRRSVPSCQQNER